MSLLLKEVEIGNGESYSELLSSCGDSIGAVMSFAIGDWIRGKPYRSLNSLARLSGIPYHTLRRIELRQNEPSLENFILLIAVIFDAGEQGKLFAKYYPKIWEVFEHKIKVP